MSAVKKPGALGLLKPEFDQTDTSAANYSGQYSPNTTPIPLPVPTQALCSPKRAPEMGKAVCCFGFSLFLSRPQAEGIEVTFSRDVGDLLIPAKCN